MNQDQLKNKVAEAALEYINQKDDLIIGIGTGSTVNAFIELLPTVRNKIRGCVSSSKTSTEKLLTLGFDVLELNHVNELPLYIDGADECDAHNRLIKGGGGALTQEKIIAEAASKFICIVDESKIVPLLGTFPLPIEVIPMARSMVARKMVALGGQPIYRENFITDNGNMIIDVHNLKIIDPIALEQKINQIPGIVTNGLFARRGANTTLIATSSGKIIKQ